MEWRFFATMLVMEYMRDDDFLCVPFNLIPSPRKIFKLYQNLIRWCQKDVKKETKYEEQEYFEVPNSCTLDLHVYFSQFYLNILWIVLIKFTMNG